MTWLATIGVVNSVGVVQPVAVAHDSSGNRPHFRSRENFGCADEDFPIISRSFSGRSLATSEQHQPISRRIHGAHGY